MIKYIFLLLLIPSLAFAGTSSFGGNPIANTSNLGGVAIGNIASFGGNDFDTCAEIYAYDDPADSDVPKIIGGDTDQHYAGTGYDPASGTECICQIDIYITSKVEGSGAGTLDSAMFYSKIWTLTSDELAAPQLGQSTAVAGSAISDTSWVSFTFSTCVNATSGTPVAIAFYRDDNNDGTPQLDASNYLEYGMANENSAPGEGGVDAIQGPRYGWTHDAGLPYPDYLNDPEDDIIIRVYSE